MLCMLDYVMFICRLYVTYLEITREQRKTKKKIE